MSTYWLDTFWMLCIVAFYAAVFIGCPIAIWSRCRNGMFHREIAEAYPEQRKAA